ncbi:hypothetical protein AOLI_G00077250 [Acnodon oligacanthus]
MGEALDLCLILTGKIKAPESGENALQRTAHTCHRVPREGRRAALQLHADSTGRHTAVYKTAISLASKVEERALSRCHLSAGVTAAERLEEHEWRRSRPALPNEGCVHQFSARSAEEQPQRLM